MGWQRRVIRRMLFYTVTVFVISGCGPWREDVYSEFSIRRGPVTNNSTVDIRVGQIVYHGPDRGQGIVTEADVFVDGIPVKGIFRPGDWLPVSTSVGRHLLEAHVYRVFQGQRVERMGCFKQVFEVSAFRRNAEMPTIPRNNWEVPGFWWRMEISSVSPGC